MAGEYLSAVEIEQQPSACLDGGGGGRRELGCGGESQEAPDQGGEETGG
jgi:hypothetical protein